LIRIIISKKEDCKKDFIVSNCWLKILEIISSSNIDLGLHREGTLLLLDLSKRGFREIEDIKIVNYQIFINLL
jgi:hypothetical protein